MVAKNFMGLFCDTYCTKTSYVISLLIQQPNVITPYIIPIFS